MTTPAQLGQTLSDIQKQIQNSGLYELQEQARQYLENIQPYVDSANRAYASIDCAFRFIDEDVKQAAKRYEEMLASVSASRLAWLSSVCDLSPTVQAQDNQKAHKLIEIDGDKIIFNLQETKHRKLKSQHRYVLIALISLPYQEGYISYEAIEEFLVKNGRKPKHDKKKSRKRIWNSCDAIFRFLGVPKVYKGLKLIETVPGKGLKLNNPVVKIT